MNEAERFEWREIERVLCKGAPVTQNARNDVEVVFNGKKYGAILVTNDGGSRRQPGGILGNRNALRAIGITVMTDAEAITHVRTKISQRDNHLKQMASAYNTPLPQWIGID